MSLSQPFLEKEDKINHRYYENNYGQLRVDIFKIIISTDEGMTDKRAELFTEDILNAVDKHIVEMIHPDPEHLRR